MNHKKETIELLSQRVRIPKVIVANLPRLLPVALGRSAGPPASHRVSPAAAAVRRRPLPRHDASYLSQNCMPRSSLERTRVRVCICRASGARRAPRRPLPAAPYGAAAARRASQPSAARRDGCIAVLRNVYVKKEKRREWSFLVIVLVCCVYAESPRATLSAVCHTARNPRGLNRGPNPHARFTVSTGDLTYLNHNHNIHEKLRESLQLLTLESLKKIILTCSHSYVYLLWVNEKWK